MWITETNPPKKPIPSYNQAFFYRKYVDKQKNKVHNLLKK